MLDAAAGYAAYRDAGPARPGSCPEPPPAPRQDPRLRPRPRPRLLLTFLADRAVGLVDAWLSACAARGLGVRARAWVPLATAAALAARARPGAGAGGAGRARAAFLALHPRWRALAVPRPAPWGPASDQSAAPAPGWSRRPPLALAAVQVTRSLGRRRLSVRSPDGHDLSRLVADTDLSAWPRHTGLDPEEFLAQLRGAVGDRFPELRRRWRTRRSPSATNAGSRRWSGPARRPSRCSSRCPAPGRPGRSGGPGAAGVRCR